MASSESKPSVTSKCATTSVDVKGLDEHLDELPQLVLPPVGFHLLGKDLDLPTGQLRRQAHILAAPSDGVALLVLGNHHFHPRRFIIENDLCHLGRNSAR